MGFRHSCFSTKKLFSLLTMAACSTDILRYLFCGTPKNDEKNSHSYSYTKDNFFLLIKDLALCRRVNQLWYHILKHPKLTSFSYTQWSGWTAHSGFFEVPEGEIMKGISNKYLITNKKPEGVCLYQKTPFYPGVCSIPRPLFYFVSKILPFDIQSCKIREDKLFWDNGDNILGCYNLIENKNEWKFRIPGKLYHSPSLLLVDDKDFQDPERRSHKYYQIYHVKSIVSRTDHNWHSQLWTYRVQEEKKKSNQKKTSKWKMFGWQVSTSLLGTCYTCFDNMVITHKRQVYFIPCKEHEHKWKNRNMHEDEVPKPPARDRECLPIMQDHNRGVLFTLSSSAFHYNEEQAILYRWEQRGWSLQWELDDWGDKNRDSYKFFAYKLHPKFSPESGRKYMECTFLFEVNMSNLGDDVTRMVCYGDWVYFYGHRKIWSFSLNHL